MRAPAYEAAAHLTVDTDACSVDDVVTRVLEGWRTWNG
jgi:uncharacterized protein YaiI (UPF0178 family)